MCDDVFVCGDACHLERPDCPDWFQMRLWSQARTMGLYTAQSMAGALDDLEGGFAFELFAHATNLLGFKVRYMCACSCVGVGVGVLIVPASRWCCLGCTMAKAWAQRTHKLSNEWWQRIQGL